MIEVLVALAIIAVALAASSSGHAPAFPTEKVNHHCPLAPAANASAFCSRTSAGVSLRCMSTPSRSSPITNNGSVAVGYRRVTAML